MLCGVGDKDAPGFLSSLRTTTRQALTCSYLKGIELVEVIPPRTGEPVVLALIEGVMIGTYSWKKYRRPEPEAAGDLQVTIAAEASPVYQDAVTVCEGVTLARDLINENADVANSEYFEQAVRAVIKDCPQASLEVLNESELRAKGLNLHLAVNQGSRHPAKLIIVRYNGAGAGQPATALVGKGITFDSGGLNLKPTGHIETMRCDMSGAAAVLGTLQNAIRLGVKVNLLFAFGLAENAIGSRAYKPGDVLTSFSGKTVEIANTDAEGRLVLADALAYVIKTYDPARVLDIATLTGACVVALGYDYTGLVTTDEGMAAGLLAAGQATDDRVWRLPTYPELTDSVESLVADIRNTGFPKGTAGTITAAEFLRQFVSDKPWAHLDIAGTAFREGKGRWYYGPGATGAGVRLLTEFIRRS